VEFLEKPFLAELNININYLNDYDDSNGILLLSLLF